jgi:hypothetical protein
MSRTFRWVVLLGLVAPGSAWPAPAKYKIKPVKAEPPKELKDSIRKLLNDQAIQLLDAKEAPLCQVWFRKVLPAKATDEQIKNGLTYRELKETTLLGAIQFLKQGSDYRKQKIKPGVYTLRLAFQLMDGDHMGVSAHQEFCLLVSADKDKSPETFEPKALHERSTKSVSTTHPGCLMLFPYEKPKPEAHLASKGNNHWVLQAKEEVDADGKKTALGIGLNLIGHAD